MQLTIGKVMRFFFAQLVPLPRSLRPLGFLVIIILGDDS
jgi:hypothetical protein